MVFGSTYAILHVLLEFLTQVEGWLSSGNTLDVRSWVQFPPGQSCVTTLGKLHVYTYMPLSPSSITRYWSKDGDVLRLGRWPQRKVMAAYRRDDLKYHLTACTTGSAPGPALRQIMKKKRQIIKRTMTLWACGLALAEQRRRRQHSRTEETARLLGQSCSGTDKSCVSVVLATTASWIYWHLDSQLLALSNKRIWRIETSANTTSDKHITVQHCQAFVLSSTNYSISRSHFQVPVSNSN